MCAHERQLYDGTIYRLQVIRQYHGHLSGVYSLALHPTLDILCTGGRDSGCRVGDVRTKVQVGGPLVLSTCVSHKPILTAQCSQILLYACRMICFTSPKPWMPCSDVKSTRTSKYIL